MKNQNIQTLRHLQHIGFIYKIKNASLIRKLYNIVENTSYNKFLMYIIFKKKVVDVLQRFAIYDIKKTLFKNLIWSVKKDLSQYILKSKL